MYKEDKEEAKTQMGRSSLMKNYHARTIHEEFDGREIDRPARIGLPNAHFPETTDMRAVWNINWASFSSFEGQCVTDELRERNYKP